MPDSPAPGDPPAAPSNRPVLYSFRRCPYAMRARMALHASGQSVALREILLRDKPAAMVALSPKATVPVLHLTDGTVLEESLEIMDWALGRNDPDRWRTPDTGGMEAMRALIADCDGPFKQHLDRYKYAVRYEAGTDPLHHRSEGLLFLERLNTRLADRPFLFGTRVSLADIAIFPFIRQYANTDRAWFDAQPLPHLQDWLIRHLDSSLFADIMHKWPVWAPGDEEPVFPAP